VRFALSDQDIRWQQRLANYTRALAQLTRAVELAQTRALSELEKQGLIQAFAFVFELAWNLMKDYFLYQGNPAISGSRDAIRTAFKQGLIADGEGWMEMIKSRNQTAHTYNESVANAIAGSISAQYQALFVAFQHYMQALADADPDAL
jgi:nucleotidyltransferase substrate binding protein (TIGR01987 family)